MSKIGKLPIAILSGITVKLDAKTVKVSGPKGELSLKLPNGIDTEVKDNQLLVKSKIDTKRERSLYGTTRSLLANIFTGVNSGWKKQLELVGTGYRAEVAGDTLVLTVGFSHPVKLKAPTGISFKVDKGMITVEGIDKELVGQISANVRGVQPPEPYKGKGIKYVDEVVRRKAGKAAKTAAA